MWEKRSQTWLTVETRICFDIVFKRSFPIHCFRVVNYILNNYTSSLFDPINFFFAKCFKVRKLDLGYVLYKPRQKQTNHLKVSSHLWTIVYDVSSDIFQLFDNFDPRASGPFFEIRISSSDISLQVRKSSWEGHDKYDKG